MTILNININLKDLSILYIDLFHTTTTYSDQGLSS